MLEMKTSNIIMQLVDQFLDRRTPALFVDENNGIQRSAMVFQINAEISKYTEELDAHSYRNIFLLFCGNTSVWIASQDPREDENRWHSVQCVPLDAWENTSNHDSCWRSDGLDSPLSCIYFDMCDEANEQLPEKDQCAPINMSQHNRFGTFGLGNVFEHVNVTHVGADRNDSYHRKVISVERVDK